MEASHCVCSVLGDHQRLPVRLSPPSQGGDNLPGDQLGVAWVGVPGGVLVHPDDVHVASHVIRGAVLVRVVVVHCSDWPCLVQGFHLVSDAGKVGVGLLHVGEGLVGHRPDDQTWVVLVPAY